MAELLKKYRAMRDFDATPEPASGRPRKGKPPLFVIQKHRASRLHYDFRLEMEGVLKSWAVPKGPSYDPATKRLAMQTEDHPYDYAAFEGIIPEGNYGAGNVIIWDTGTWEFVEPGDDPVRALAEGKLTFRLFGKKMFGEWALVKIHGKGGSDRGNEWLLLKHRDEFASEKVDITVVAPLSVVSNRTVENVSHENVWESNRRKGGRKAPSEASRLEEKDEKQEKKQKTKTGATRKRVAATRKASAAKPAKKTAGKRRGSAAPSRALSAPTRSSRARSPRSAQTTSRRPPR